MEEFGFGDDLFEQKQKNSSQDNNYEYNAKIEEALWYKNNANILAHKEDQIAKYHLDNLYLNKQYKEVIEHAVSHFQLPLTTNEIMETKKKKKGDGGMGRRLAEVYDVLVWCYFNLGSWEMAEQILLALVQLQPHNFVYWRILGTCQSNMDKYDAACESFFKSIKQNVNYIDAWLDTSINYLRARNYAIARKCFAHTRWLAQRLLAHHPAHWRAHEQRILSACDAHTSGAEWSDETTDVRYHPCEEVAKMEREFMNKVYKDDVDDGNKEDGDNPMNL